MMTLTNELPAPKRLLVLNWRDPWHPRSGGAEVLTLRILERLAAWNWDIEWFSAAYPGAEASEVRNGIRFERAGNQMTVHFCAAQRYRKRKDFDGIIDQINTIPFYAMNYAVPSISWFQQLAKEVWLYEAPPLIGTLGYISESWYLRPYRNQPIITISPSSAESLREIGLRGPIRLIPMASDEHVLSELHHIEPEPVIVIVGRVAPSKRIEESIHALHVLHGLGWKGRIEIIGGGNPTYQKKLEALISRLHLTNFVHFAGRVTPEERSALFARASLLWMTSIREGWGLVVTEAAAKGTPAVVYDVPGLRDAVRHRETGMVVPPRPEALAKASLEILADRWPYARAAHAFAASLGWNQTAHAFGTHVHELLQLDRSSFNA